jgi:hypothetical protein
MRFSCGHSSHNLCVITRMVEDGFRIRCTTCYRLLVPDAELTRLLENDNVFHRHGIVRDDGRVQNLVDTNTEVKEAVKDYRKSYGKIKTHMRLLRRGIKPIIEEYRAETNAYLQMLRITKKRYMSRIKCLEPYRNAIRTIRELGAIQLRLNEMWDIHPYHMQRLMNPRGDTRVPTRQSHIHRILADKMRIVRTDDL